MFVPLLLLLMAAPDYPAAPRATAGDDPYRPLEDLDSPAVHAWLDAQTRLLADRIDRRSLLEQYERRIRAVQDHTAYWTVVPAGRRSVLVGSHGATGGSSPAVALFMREGEGRPRPILNGTTTTGRALSRWVAVDPAGRRLAFLSGEPGSRWLRLGVLDLDRLELLGDELEGLHTTAPQVAWLPDGRGLVYAHFQRPVESRTAAVPAPRLRLHRLGRPQAEDDVLLSPDTAWQSWLTPRVSADGRSLMVEGARGGSGRADLWMAPLSAGVPSQLKLVLVDVPGSPRLLGNLGRELVVEETGRVVAIDPARPQPTSWRVLLPATGDALVFAALAGERLLAVRSRDARPVLAVHALDGRWQHDVALPAGHNIWGPPWGFGITGPERGRHAWFNSTSLGDPGTLYRLDTWSGTLERWQSAEMAFDPDRFVTRHVLVEAGDGVRVPVFVCHARDVVADGRRPTILYAYGALSWSAFPWFQPQMVAFLEQGGVFAVAGVRGGGEYGEAWHRAGAGLNRRRAVADVRAVAAWLVRAGWTSASRLAAQGSSLGTGLIALAALEHPQDFAAVLLDIPVLDLVRYGDFTGGRLWRDELGWADTPEAASALRAISPYHRVQPGCHPATLVSAGSRDETAVPLHAYKYVAALQAAQACDRPVLLQVIDGAGHSLGASPEQAARSWARQLVFLDSVFGSTP